MQDSALGYAPGTGLYTPPVDGLYEIEATVCASSTNWTGPFEIFLEKNGVVLTAAGPEPDPGPQWRRLPEQQDLCRRWTAAATISGSAPSPAAPRRASPPAKYSSVTIKRVSP
jgi:hypothetical protein